MQNEISVTHVKTQAAPVACSWVSFGNLEGNCFVVMAIIVLFTYQRCTHNSVHLAENENALSINSVEMNLYLEILS